MRAIYCKGSNAGDMITEAILRRLGHEPEHVQEGPGVCVCGSISHLCGAGVLALGTGSFRGCGPRGGAAAFVRGPATARLWGDPGLWQCEAGLMLAPLMGAVPGTGTYTGVVWHYADPVLPLPLHCVRISTALPPEDFVRAIAGCGRCISSSLHGIVVADSLGIGCVRLASANVRDFDYKHEDYYNGTGRDLMPALGLGQALDADPWVWDGQSKIETAISLTRTLLRSIT